MHFQERLESSLAALQALRHTGQIRAISLDLDDTLWPIWPTIAKAEAALLQWLKEHASVTALHLGDTVKVRALRQEIVNLRPDLQGDLSALRRESIRLALQRAGDDPALAEPAFDVFFAARQRVDLFEDALPALEFLSQRWPVVALSNGNADVHVVALVSTSRPACRPAAAEWPNRKPVFFRQRLMRWKWLLNRCCISATMLHWMSREPWMRVCTRSGSTAGS